MVTPSPQLTWLWLLGWLSLGPFQGGTPRCNICEEGNGCHQDVGRGPLDAIKISAEEMDVVLVGGGHHYPQEPCGGQECTDPSPLWDRHAIGSAISKVRTYEKLVSFDKTSRMKRWLLQNRKLLPWLSRAEPEGDGRDCRRGGCSFGVLSRQHPAVVKIKAAGELA